MSERTEESIEYQIGEHDVDTDSVELGDENEFIEFELEAKAVFNRIARDIYESKEAGVREPLANAFTAVIRAQEEYDLGKTEGCVEVILNGKNELIIQDNGIGISEEVLREVLAVIGRSSNRNREDLSGNFGMGFLAIWMLCGLDGGFIMHTKSRKEGEEQISGVWKNGGFSRSPPEEFETSMDEDQYGTRFEIKITDTISPSRIRKWVSKHSKWARVPVIYREFDENGSEVFNEDYGDENISNAPKENSPRIVLETDNFKAVNYPTVVNRSGDTVLLDVAIDRNNSVKNAPFSRVDIRLKKESGIVVDGPNKGLIPINKNEYKEKENKEKYISKDRLNSKDIVMPSPTGTRDKLESRDEFWEWLGEKLTEKYRTHSIDIFQKIESPDELYDLSKEKIAMAVEYSRSKSTGKNPLQSLTSLGLSKETARELIALTENVTVRTKDDNGNLSDIEEYSVSAYIPAWETKNSDGEVYMGVSLNSKKAKVVFQDNDNNYVVEVDNTDYYERLEPLGWKKIKNVGSSNIDNFDVDESLKEQFRTKKKGISVRKNPGEEKLTLHFSRRDSANIKKKASEIKEFFSTSIKHREKLTESKNPERLIVFPSNSDYSISNNYWLANEKTPITKCSVSAYEYLSENTNIFHIDDYISRAEESDILTQNGRVKMKNLPEDALIHIVKEQFYDIFSDFKYMDRYAEYLRDEVMTGNSWKNTEMDSVVYCVIPESKYYIIEPALRNCHYIVGDSAMGNRVGDENSIKNDTLLYAYGRLYDWRGTKELERVMNMSASLSDGGYDLIETLGKLYDSGNPPNSELRR